MTETEAEVPFEEPEQDETPSQEPQDGADDEEGEEDEQEPEAAQEPAQSVLAPSEQDLERASKAMDRAAKAYIDKAVNALGNDLGGFVACPMCRDYWPGLRLNRVPEGETLADVQRSIGQDPDPPLKPDVFSRPCEVCDGYGKVASFAKDPARKSLTCLECKGLGYIPTDPRREGGRITALNGPSFPAPEIPQPFVGDEPPEAQALRDLGWVVVQPITPVTP